MENNINDKIIELKTLILKLKDEHKHLQEQLLKAQNTAYIKTDTESEKDAKISLLENQIQILLFSLDKMNESEKKNFELKIGQFIKTIDGAIHHLTQ